MEKVLFVDDDKEILRAYRRLFEDRFVVFDASSAADGLVILRENTDIAVVVSDLAMPEMDGVEFFEQVRVLQPFATRIMLTGNADVRKAGEAINRGQIYRYLVKPCGGGEMGSAIDEAIAYGKELREMVRRTVTDGLTGLLNHVAISERLEVELARARRYGSYTSVAMVDLDHFKKINDTFGHVVGDEVLRRVATLIQNELRRVDIVGRWGGEEFFAIFPETPIDGARLVMDRIREKFAALGWTPENLHPTFSVGVAQFIGETALELVDRADKALYVAKEEGRNRVVVATPLTFR